MNKKTNKTENTEKKKAGHPFAVIDQAQFETLCGLQCTEDEICAIFGGITDKTLTSWCRRTYGKTFQEAFKVFRKRGYMSLRRIQWGLAEKSPAMAIFLGKNYLGQSDKYESKTESVVKIVDDIPDNSDTDESTEEGSEEESDSDTDDSRTEDGE